jgi:hypothetical protein
VPPFVDVNGDGYLSPSDALVLINYIKDGGVQAEGEGSASGANINSAQQNKLATRIVDIKSGVAAMDNAKGFGFIMYSEENVFKRFALNRPYFSNSKHFIAVKFENSKWFYDNNAALHPFTPVASDLLLASVDFSADTTTSLEGTASMLDGIEAGYESGDLKIFANRFNGRFNRGEFEVKGTQFVRNSITKIGSVGAGVAAMDRANGVGFIMYSQENIFNRFAPKRPHRLNSEHLIAVKYQNGQWFFDNNRALYSFTPVPSDLLLAEVNFSADTITGLQGRSSFIDGIEAGYRSGDLKFFANRFNNRRNRGEFQILGSHFFQ